MRFKALIGAVVALAATISMQSGALAYADPPQCPQPGSALCTLFRTLVPATDQKQLDEAADYLATTLADLDAQWTDWFLRSKLQEPWVQYLIVRPGGTVMTDCPPNELITTDTQNAIYCSADSFQGNDGKTHKGRIVLPLVALYRIWNGDVFGSQIQAKRKFGAAVIAAHEFGHSVRQALSDQLNVSGPLAMENELLADCFAANWVHVQDTLGRLQPGDMDAALATIWAVGDSGFDKVDPHGTPQQRHDAFMQGLDGSPAKCMQAYWPQAFNKL